MLEESQKFIAFREQGIGNREYEKKVFWQIFRCTLIFGNNYSIIPKTYAPDNIYSLENYNVIVFKSIYIALQIKVRTFINSETL